MKTTTRKRVAIGLSALALFGVGGIVTTAAFSDSTSVTAVAETGTIEITADGESASFELTEISSTLFTPGTAVSQTFELANAGNLHSTASITSTISGDSDLAEELTAQIQVVGASTPSPYSGPLVGLGLNGIDLGGESSQDIRVTVTAPEGLANSLQGKTANVTLAVSAVQK